MILVGECKNSSRNIRLENYIRLDAYIPRKSYYNIDHIYNRYTLKYLKAGKSKKQIIFGHDNPSDSLHPPVQYGVIIASIR